MIFFYYDKILTIKQSEKIVIGIRINEDGVVILNER